MHVFSLAQLLQSKYPGKNDQELRFLLLESATKPLADFSQKNWFVHNKVTGLEQLPFNAIKGLSYTGADSTIMFGRTTVADHYERKVIKLEHPKLPLVVVRRDVRAAAQLHYDYLPLECVFVHVCEEIDVLLN